MHRFAVCNAVFGRLRHGRIGTFAEHMTVHQDELAHKPAPVV